MGLIENIIKKVVMQSAEITQKEKLSESIYKIRLTSNDIKSAEFKPGYFLRVGIGLDNDSLSTKDKIRSYSVWNINKQEGYLDLAISTESNGAGAQWVINCKERDTVYFKWKKGNFIIDDNADSYLMIGDLSALSHLYIIKRELSSNKQVESIIYSHDNHIFFEDVDKSKPFNFHELEQNPIDKVLSIVKDIIPNMKGEKMVYIAGDSRLCIALNQYFRNELKWNTKQIKTKPFWNPLKKGLE